MRPDWRAVARRNGSPTMSRSRPTRFACWSAVTWSALVATSARRSTRAIGSILQQRMPELVEGVADAADREAQIGEGLVPLLQRRQEIDQQHLLAHAAEDVAMELPDQLQVGGMALQQRGAHRAAPCAESGRSHAGEREEQRSRIDGRLVGQRKASRLDEAEVALLPAAHEIVAVEAGDARQLGRILGRGRIERAHGVQPRLRQVRAPRAVGQLLHLQRPVAERLGQHRQVEQPLAGIVDEIEIGRGRGRERRAQQADIAVTDAHPQAAEAGRRRGPVGLFGQQPGEALLERKRGTPGISSSSTSRTCSRQGKNGKDAIGARAAVSSAWAKAVMNTVLPDLWRPVTAIRCRRCDSGEASNAAASSSSEPAARVFKRDSGFTRSPRSMRVRIWESSKSEVWQGRVKEERKPTFWG